MQVSRRIRVLSVIALLALGCSVTAASAANSPTRTLHLAGAWSGSYSGAVAGKFTLRWTQTGSRLIGSITLSNPHGRYSISGNVRGSAIKFGAVGVGAIYTGTVKGKSMSGTWKSGPGGGSWSAGKS